MSVKATRRLQYAIGHRILGHEGKCRCLHGHNFVFYLTAQRDQLSGEQDSLGRVIDFSVLKERLGSWIELTWDHGMVLWDRDEEAIAACRYLPGQKLALLPFNPTAENLGLHLLHVVGPELLRNTGVKLVRVVVHETENGIAEVE